MRMIQKKEVSNNCILLPNTVLYQFTLNNYIDDDFAMMCYMFVIFMLICCQCPVWMAMLF